MKIKNITINKLFIISEYLYWYFLYAFAILALVMIIYFTIINLFVLVGILLLLVMTLMTSCFNRPTKDNYVLQFNKNNIVLYKNDIMIKMLNEVENVNFILSGYKDESVIFSFSQKSGRNKLKIQSGGYNKYFLFELRTRNDYETFMYNYLQLKTENNVSYKLNLKKQFLS